MHSTGTLAAHQAEKPVAEWTFHGCRSSPRLDRCEDDKVLVAATRVDHKQINQSDPMRFIKVVYQDDFGVHLSGASCC
jgi:hypothetical protein